MPLYLDIHQVDAIDTEALAHAHARDLEVQGDYGVNYVRYWFSEELARVFCLVDAPSKDAAIAVHREAHGMVADEIIEVVEGR